MKRTQRKIEYIPIGIFECFRACDNKIYLVCKGEMVFYEFLEREDFEKWKSERSKENMKRKNFEGYMACDENGFYSIQKEFKIKKMFGIKNSVFNSFVEYVEHSRVNGTEIDWDYEI